MKTPAAILITLLFLLGNLIFVSSNPRAQEFDFTRAYQDYLYAQNTYNQAYSSYQSAKDFYQTTPTLTLKEDARKKTLTMLRERDNLTAVYLTALRMKIVETKGLGEEEKNTIFGKIDPEVKWYQDHKGNYQDGDPLETLFTKSDESDARYKANTLPIIYETLFNISLGAEIGFRKDQETIYSSLKEIINVGVTDGTLDINPFNRWFSDIESLTSTLKQNEDASRTQIQKVYGQYFSLQGAYNTAAETLESSLVSIKQLNTFLIEVVTSIRNQQK